jgi:hypothetical protein
LDYRILVNEWNKIQYNAGWLNDFHEKHGHWKPNSTDIHSVRNVDKIDLYIAKYISKNGGQINGKCWDTSNTLAGKKYFTFEQNWNNIEPIEKAVATGEIEVKTLDHCAILQTRHPKKFIPPNEQAAFQAWLK